MTREELLDAYATGRRDFAGANLREGNLSGSDLRGSDLSGSVLCGTDLRGANLRGANLRGANLSLANLSKTHFTHDLSGANLSEADLRGANLRGANLIGANLTKANLFEADLTGADLTGADLTGSDFSGEDLTGAELTRANFTDADLRGMLQQESTTRMHQMGTPESRFRQICSELGWGEPKGGLWFIGIEEREGFNPGDEERIERLYGHSEFFRDAAVERMTRPPDMLPKDGRSRPKYVESNIAAQLSSSNPDPSSFRESAMQFGGSVAHANLYPLGKRSTNNPFPRHYADLFGFGSGEGERERYREAVHQYRFPRLLQAVSELQPQAIVCMGDDHWDEFREAFAVHSKPRSVVKGKLYIHEEEKIILAQHLDRKWVNSKREREHRDQVAEVLRDWGVKLP